MDTPPLRLTLEPLFSTWGRQVQVWQDALEAPEAPANAPADTHGSLLATMELNRTLALSDGSRYAIQRLGAPWSSHRALWRGAGPMPGELPLATYRRERVGLLRWRSILRVCPDAGGGTAPTASSSAYVLRRRSWWGAPSNVDLLALPAEGADGAEGREPQATPPALLRVERVGRWKRRLKAVLRDPNGLSLPLALFVLNLLAVQERAAASSAAAAAGA
jgi:hypothetical protein